MGKYCNEYDPGRRGRRCELRDGSPYPGHPRELPRLRLRLRGLRRPRPLSPCYGPSCINVAQQYAPANTKCDGSDVKWDTTAAGCTDLYGAGTQLSTWGGGGCLNSTGSTTVVQDASATCYTTQESTNEASATTRQTWRR